MAPPVAGAGDSDSEAGGGGRTRRGSGGWRVKRGSFLQLYEGALLQGIDVTSPIGRTPSLAHAEQHAVARCGMMASERGGGGNDPALAEVATLAAARAAAAGTAATAAAVAMAIVGRGEDRPDRK